MRPNRVVPFLIIFVCLIGGVFVLLRGAQGLSSLPPPRDPANLWTDAVVPASPIQRAYAVQVVNHVLNAFNKDNYYLALQSWSMQSRLDELTPNEFRTFLEHNHPEIAHSRRVWFGQAYAGEEGRLLSMDVTIAGTNGFTTRGMAFLSYENGRYRLMGIRTRPPGEGVYNGTTDYHY